MSDLEARIKALEEKLTPDPLKISTMKASNLLKQYLDENKIERESQEDVMWRIIEQAERVPELEKRIQELEDENEKLKEENTDLDQRVEELMSGELD